MAELQTPPATEQGFKGEQPKWEDILRHADTGGTKPAPAQQTQTPQQPEGTPVSPFARPTHNVNPLFSLGGPEAKEGFIPPPDEEANPNPTPNTAPRATSTALVTMMDISMAMVCMMIAGDPNSKMYRLNKEDKEELIEAAIPWIETTNMNLPPWVPFAILSIVIFSGNISTAVKRRNQKKEAMDRNAARNEDGPGTITDVNPEDIEEFVTDIELEKNEGLKMHLQDIQHQCRMNGFSEGEIFKNFARPPKGYCEWHWYFLDQKVRAENGNRFASGPNGKSKTFSNSFNGIKARYMRFNIPWIPDLN